MLKILDIPGVYKLFQPLQLVDTGLKYEVGRDKRLITLVEKVAMQVAINILPLELNCTL